LRHGYFGATGDLTKRKLIPALCNLAQDNLLPEQFAIVGFATNDYTTESFRKMLGEEIPKYAPTPVDLKFWDGSRADLLRPGRFSGHRSLQSVERAN